MTAALNLQSLAQLSAERIINCTAEGMVIALLAWVLLRAIGPRNSSNTRFAVWFAALLGIAALPLFGNWAASGTELTQRSEISLPASWALYVFAAWALMAFVGLLRVAVGFWHLQRLRENCVPVDLAALDPLLQKTLAEFDSPRTVTLCVSDELRVPTAIGFTKPRVVIPSWTVEELSSLELNAILLHELAHLRRRDDWTNLIQKLVKAVLFFHPGVWWMEKELSLHREMACDDEVLAETGNPRSYAESLARVAERNFLRRQIAMAQAAVSKMRQLSTRVTRILDPNRGQSTKIWKPAVPAVVALALVSGASVSWVPNLVKVDDGASSVSTQAASRSSSSVMPSAAPQLAPPVHPSVRAWPASLRSDRTNQTHARSLYVPARATSVKKFTPVRTLKTQTAKAKAQHQEHAPVILAKFEAPTGQGKVQSDAAAQPQEQQQRFVLVIETRQTVTAGANGLQVSVQQLRWLVPVNRIQKQLPSKT